MSTTLITSGDDMNSYVTLEEANAYFAGRFAEGIGWNAFTDAQKEMRLIQAVRLIDMLRFVGVKVVATQRLQWPRTDLPMDKVQIDGTSPYDLTTPKEIGYAECELALVVFDDEGFARTDKEAKDGAQLTSESLGDYSYSKQAEGVSDVVSELFPVHFSRAAMTFLYPYLEWDPQIFRM